MLPRWLRPALFAALALPSVAAIGARPAKPVLNAVPAPAIASVIPPLTIDGLGKGTIALDGPWQFHLGDDPNFASPDIDDQTGHAGWEQLNANSTWGAQGHPAYTGYAWYRRHVHITTAHGASPDLAMLVERVHDVYQIYWNGTLVGQYGKLPPHAKYAYTPPSQTFGLGPARDGVIAFRIWKGPLLSFDSDQLGGFVLPPVIGSPTAIQNAKAELDYTWLRSGQYIFAMHSLYALVMVLSFIGWLRRRSQEVLFWMAIFCMSPVLALLLNGLRIPFSSTFTLAWLQPVLSLQDVGLWFLLLCLLKLTESPRLVHFTRVLAIAILTVTSLDGLLVTLDWSNPSILPFAQFADAVFTAFFTFWELYPLVLVYFAFRKRLDSARWLVAMAALTTEMLTVIRVGAQQGSRFTHWTLGDRIARPMFYINGNAFTAQTIADTLLFLAILYAAYRYAQETMRRQSAMAEEFRSARELQQVLIPETLPTLPGYELTSAYRPAQEVGGDFFQILPLEGKFTGSTLIVLGDVSGKGLRAAMAVSLIVGMIRALADSVSGPGELLAELNRRLYGRLQGGFTTCVALRLDGGGICVVSSAGHPSPFVNGNEITQSGALPLGLAPIMRYGESVLRLRTGDHMALYTDGLLEARNATGDLYGFDRMHTLFATRPNAATATEAAVDFGQDDDITVLVLNRLATGQESTTTLTMPILARSNA